MKEALKLLVVFIVVCAIAAVEPLVELLIAVVGPAFSAVFAAMASPVAHFGVVGTVIFSLAFLACTYVLVTGNSLVARAETLFAKK